MKNSLCSLGRPCLQVAHLLWQDCNFWFSDLLVAPLILWFHISEEICLRQCIVSNSKNTLLLAPVYCLMAESDSASVSATAKEEVATCAMDVKEEAEAAAAEEERTETETVQLPNSGYRLIVRQLPSRGLSFQVWPAASALCLLLDQIPLLNKTHNQIPHPQDNPQAISSALAETDSSSNTILGIWKSLLQRKQSEKGSRRIRVLELGAGTGMVGIAATMILGAHVTITDLPHVIPNIMFNISANEELISSSGNEGCISAVPLRWGELNDVRQLGDLCFDMILASDVVYHEHLFEPLLLTLRWLVFGIPGAAEPVPASVLIAHLRRWKKDAIFFRKARKFFDVRVVHKQPPEPGARLGVVVYCFERKKNASQFFQ